MYYDDLNVHLQMLRDGLRTDGYRRAIEATVRPGHRVLDFGCGTGALSFFAARAGARVVYAMDRSAILEVASELARVNGFGNVVCLAGDHTSVTLPEPVDVIVSEWMGHFALGERMLEPLIAMRDKYLAPGGIMVPHSVSLRAALVTTDRFFTEQSFFRARPYGLSFGAFADWPLHRVAGERFAASEVIEPYFDLGTLDMQTCARTPAELSGSITAGERSTVYGLCGWFDAALGHDVELRTGPADAPTHWMQVYYPLATPFEVHPGDVVTATIRPMLRPDLDRTLWLWSVRANDRVVQMDDFLHETAITTRTPRRK